MRGNRWELSSDAVMENFQAFVSQMRLSGKRPVFELVPEKRSLSQNDLIYAMYQEIASQVEDQSIADIRRECKLVHGVPILRGGNEKFRAMYDKAIRGNLTYEEKLDAMEILPVTSLMSKEQGTEYIDTVIREYTKRGCSIISPSEAP